MECIRQADDSKSGVQELCESQSGLPGLPVPSSPYGLCGRKATLNYFRAQELCESRGGRPGLPVPNSPYGLCGRKATLNWNSHTLEVKLVAGHERNLQSDCVVLL